jgi:hypothetical protein
VDQPSLYQVVVRNLKPSEASHYEQELLRVTQALKASQLEWLLTTPSLEPATQEQRIAWARAGMATPFLLIKHLHHYGIEDQEILKEIAISCIRADPTLIREVFEHKYFDFLSGPAYRDVMVECAKYAPKVLPHWGSLIKQSPESTPILQALLQRNPLCLPLPLSSSTPWETLLLCAQYNDKLIAYSVQQFQITDPKRRQALAIACAQHHPQYLFEPPPENPYYDANHHPMTPRQTLSLFHLPPAEYLEVAQHCLSTHRDCAYAMLFSAEYQPHETILRLAQLCHQYNARAVMEVQRDYGCPLLTQEELDLSSPLLDRERLSQWLTAVVWEEKEK